MARIKNGFPAIVGNVSNLSFYTIQGSDQVYVRSKGGPSANAIKKKPQFEKLRRNNSEWRGCTFMGKSFRECYAPLKHLEDFPAIGTLNAIAKKIQLLDESGEHGKRSIVLSEHKEMLLGFNFSSKQVFENILRVPLVVDLSRDSGTAHVQIPCIDTSYQLYNYRAYGFFRLYFCLSAITDLNGEWEGESLHGLNIVYRHPEKSTFITDWLPTYGVIDSREVNLQFAEECGGMKNNMTLVFSVGIEFGQPVGNGEIKLVKYMGAGKIMRVG